MKLYITSGDEPAPEGFEKRARDNAFDGTAGSVEEIILSGIYERENHPHLLLAALYAILIPGGKATFISPYYACSDAWLHPDTIRGVSELSLNWTNKSWREASKWVGLPDIDFDISTALGFDQAWMLKSDDARIQALGRYVNVARTVHITLTKK